ncbi:MAG: hypothetical protein U5L75_02400 [Candidatus Campbellbacteria bacterium]|nr:hypothetical protein [Candidatus Campbellbacteria bacterium]
MKQMVSIEGLSRRKVFAALYNAARPVGMGALRYDPQPIVAEELGEFPNGEVEFDYVKGRALKLSFADVDELNVYWYNENNGEGVAERVIDILRQTGDPCAKEIIGIHERNILVSMAEARGS